MKPAPFAYVRPQTLDEALAVLAQHADDAKPLAGGQSLIPAMNFRLAAPAMLVDLNAITELAYVAEGPDGVSLGGLTRQRTIERSAVVARVAPLVSDAMPFVAHPAIRTRGTLGGSLAHADPAAELPAVMLALNASLRLRRQSGSRTVAAEDFFTGLFATAIEPGELLTDISVRALAPRSGWAFQEVSRRHGDFALTGVAVAVTLDERGSCGSVRLALFSVGDRPMLATHAANVLRGERPSVAVIRAAAEAAATLDIDPTSDIHASSRYRRHLASVLARRALTRAFDRAAIAATTG